MNDTRKWFAFRPLLLRLVAVLFAALCWPAWGHGQETTGRTKGGEVRGVVYAELGGGADVLLYGFPVTLRRGEHTETARTDAYGRFRFPRQEPGKYHLTWQAPGWKEGKSEVEVGADTGHLVVPVQPLPEDADGRPLGVLRGSVRLADGASPWFADEFFAVCQAAQIEVTGGDGRPVAVAGPGGRGEVRPEHLLANARGEFVVAGVRPQDLTVAAVLVQGGLTDKGWGGWKPLEKSRAEPVSVSQRLFGDKRVAALEKPIALPGKRPPVSMSVTVDGKPVISARPGEQVICNLKVSGEDETGKYLWKVPGKSSKLTEGPITWQLDDHEGAQNAYVLYSDEKGGYGLGRVTLPVKREPK